MSQCCVWPQQPDIFSPKALNPCVHYLLGLNRAAGVINDLMVNTVEHSAAKCPPLLREGKGLNLRTFPDPPFSFSERLLEHFNAIPVGKISQRCLFRLVRNLFPLWQQINALQVKLGFHLKG